MSIPAYSAVKIAWCTPNIGVADIMEPKGYSADRFKYLCTMSAQCCFGAELGLGSERLDLQNDLDASEQAFPAISFGGGVF